MAYVIYNPNPKQARVGDCVVRAICKAIDESWDNVFKGLSAEAYALADMPNANHVWGSFLRKHGFTRTALPDTCPDCYTVAEFAKEHNIGVYILALGNGKHAAIMAGQATHAADHTRGMDPMTAETTLDASTMCGAITHEIRTRLRRKWILEIGCRAFRMI